MEVFVKKINVHKFSDFDEISNFSATILIKDNFGFLRILWTEDKLDF